MLRPPLDRCRVVRVQEEVVHVPIPGRPPNARDQPSQAEIPVRGYTCQILLEDAADCKLQQATEQAHVLQALVEDAAPRQ